MAKTLSQDLRSRLIQVVNDGMSRRDAAELFSVGVSTAIRWVVGVQSAVSAQSGPRFASVEVGPAAPLPALAAPLSSRTEGLIEIVLVSGVSLRVDAHVDGRALRQVLSALADH